MKRYSREGCTNAIFVEVWKCLGAYYKPNLVEQADQIMDELLAIQILPGETSSANLTRTDGYIA